MTPTVSEVGSRASASTDPVALVSVVIPARNERQTIVGCLRALERQTIGAGRLEVTVVATGDDGTAEVAAAAGTGHFGRFEVLTPGGGNKNAALRVGCARARADTVVLVDADTELAPNAIDELRRALETDTGSAAHGAAVPRVETWISRYWELNRRLVKDLRFDGTLSGEVVAVPRAHLPEAELSNLFPETVGAKDDLRLGLALAARGCRIRYVPAARATTLVPWTLRGLVRTMLRNRRGAIALAGFGDATLQAAKSAVLVAALPAALVAARWSWALAALAAAPLAIHATGLAFRIEALRRRGLARGHTELLPFLGLDLLGRALKLWAFGERLAGRGAPRTFRGERPRDRASA